MLLDLSSEETRALAASVIPASAPQPFGAYVFAGDDPAAELSRVVERAVLLEAFGNTDEDLAIEYGPYEQTSFFLCILDHRRQVPAGAVRLIVPSADGPGLKTVNDLPKLWGASAEQLFRRSGLPIPLESTWDIATLAVAPEYRSAFATGLVAMGLYQTGIRIAVELGVEWMVAILDQAVYRMSKARFHQPFFPFAEGRPYLGSAESLPVYMPIADYRRRLSVDDPPIHAIFYEGVGIEAALAPVPLEIGTAVARRIYDPAQLTPTGGSRSGRGRFQAAVAGIPAPAESPRGRRAATG